MTLLLVLPLASGEGIKFTAIGFTGGEDVYITWGLFALDALIAFLVFLTIFLFKKRKLQMRLCIFNILLIIGYLIYYVVLLLNFGKGILPEQASTHLIPSFWIVLPLLSILLILLAYRGIRKDEVLVRMSKRLR